jgi:hypothetical protein
MHTEMIGDFNQIPRYRSLGQPTQKLVARHMDVASGGQSELQCSAALIFFAKAANNKTVTCRSIMLNLLALDQPIDQSLRVGDRMKRG